MRVAPDTNKLKTYTENLYKCNNTVKRLLSPSIVVIDVGINCIRNPIELTENIAFAAINIIGAIYSTEHSIDDCFDCLHHGLENIYNGIFEILKSPFDLISQFYLIIKDPENTNSIAFEHKGYTYQAQEA